MYLQHCKQIKSVNGYKFKTYPEDKNFNNESNIKKAGRQD